MSYSLRSKGRAPISDLPEKKKTPGKSSSRRRKITDDADSEDCTTTDAGLEADVSLSEIEDSRSNFGESPHVASSPLASLIERSWKSGIAELVSRKESESGEEKEEVAPEKVDELKSSVEGGRSDENEGTKEEISLLGSDGNDEQGKEDEEERIDSNEKKDEGIVAGEVVPDEDGEESDKELLDIMRDAAKECDENDKTIKTNCVDEKEDERERKSVEVDDAVKGENEYDSKDEVESDSSWVMIEKDDCEKEGEPVSNEASQRDKVVNSAQYKEINFDSELASCATPEVEKSTSEEVVTKSTEDSAKSAEREKKETNIEGMMVERISMSETVAQDEFGCKDENYGDQQTTGSLITSKDPKRMEGVEDDHSGDDGNSNRKITESHFSEKKEMEVVADDEPQSSDNQKAPDPYHRDKNFNETEASDASKVPEDPFPLPDSPPAVDDDSDDEDEDDDDEARQLAAIFKDPEEAALESIVFGDDDEIVRELEKEDPSKSSKKRKRDVETEKGVLDGDEGKTAAWSDDDDYEERIDMADPRHQKQQGGMKGKEGVVIEGAALKKKLKRDFQKVMGDTPSWAMTGGKKKEGDDDDDHGINPLLTRAGNFLNDTKGTKLGFASGILDWKKCCRANRQERGKKLRTIQFHPSAQVLMTTGLDETLRLHQIDGVHNPKIQSVAFERFPIHRSALTIDGSSAVLTSKKPWFKIYDMMTGSTTHVPSIKGKQELNKFRLTPDGRSIAFLGSHGFVYVVDLVSKEIRSSVKMNARVNDVAFLIGVPGNSSDLMVTHGDEGSVYIWDYRNTASCLHRFVDEGCLNGTVVRASTDSRFLACASTSGILNLYAAEDALKRPTPKPVKTMQNLLTNIHDVEFNRTSELMAFAAGETANGVRLAHVPTMGVFSNFPTQDSMGKPRALAFSPYSGYLAVADSKDAVNLYRLNHYENF